MLAMKFPFTSPIEQQRRNGLQARAALYATANARSRGAQQGSGMFRPAEVAAYPARINGAVREYPNRATVILRSAPK